MIGKYSCLSNDTVCDTAYLISDISYEMDGYDTTSRSFELISNTDTIVCGSDIGYEFGNYRLKNTVSGTAESISSSECKYICGGSLSSTYCSEVGRFGHINQPGDYQYEIEFFSITPFFIE